MNDLKFAFRQLRKNPGFTAVAVLTLALGIGANTAIFSVIDALLLKALPVRDPDQLVMLWTRDGSRPHSDFTFYHPMFVKFRELNRVFSSVSASWLIDRSGVMLDGPGAGVDPEQVHVNLISGDYFLTLGLRPEVGRILSLDDDRVPGAHPVVVISQGYWERRFGRAADVVGRTLRLVDTPYTIVGVAPRNFTGDWVGKPTDLWIPFMMQSQVMPDVPGLGRYPARVVGRLKPGITIDEAQSASQVLYQQLLNEAAGPNPTPQQLQQFARQCLELEPAAGGYSPQRASLSEPLTILMVVVGLVLLIACANIANLLLARGAARQREMAVRLALGAARFRIIQQLLTESFLLAIAGGVLGFLFATWGTGFLMPMLASGPAAVSLDLRPDLRAFGFTAVVCLLTGTLFGLAPAFRSARASLGSALTVRGTGTDAHGGRLGLGKLLVISQVAASLVLLAGAGLFVRTLHNLKAQDLGFDREHVLLMHTAPVQTGRVGSALTELWRTVQERLSTLPGVASVSMSLGGMVNGSEHGNASEFVRIEGREAKAGLLISSVTVSPKFFQTVGIGLLRGRDFTEQDTDTTPRVVVVSESLARFFFGDEDPVGKRLGWPGEPGFSIEIVGVVKDAKHGTPRDNRGIFYTPYGQNQNQLRGTWRICVLSAGEPVAIAPLISGALREIDGRLPILKIDTIEQQLNEVLVKERLVAILSGLFGTLAVLLACVGLYGVISQSVTRRINEIGIRMALGATTAKVLRMIFKETLCLVLAGLAIGLPATLAVTRLISSRLFGVSPADPVTLVGATTLMILVTLLASLTPARRATRVDPMEALRYE